MWKRPRDRRHRSPPDSDARLPLSHWFEGICDGACRNVNESQCRDRGLPATIMLIIVLAVVALGLATMRDVHCDETHARYFEQLRQRGLFPLAETEAISRLSTDDISLSAKTDLTIELSRTFAEHAGFVPDDQRNELWQRARQTVSQLSTREPANPRLILLEAQVGSVWAMEADWLRNERDVRTFDDALLDQARTACTKAIDVLKPLEKSLTNPTTDAAPKRSAESPLSGYERRTVMHQARWNLALSYRNQAELAGPGTAERMSDLTEADQLLRRLISAADEPLQSRAKLLNVVCLRLKGEYARAAEALGLLERSDSSGVPVIQDEITAERVRLQLALKRPADAAELVLKARTTRKRLTGEMWFLQTQSLISLRQVALEKEQITLAERLAEQIMMSIERCDEQVGGYWTRRCRQVWENVQTSQKYGVELDGLMQQARADFAAGRIDASLQKYADAELTASDREEPGLAMDLGFTRASILLDDSRFEVAAAEFLRLSTKYPSDPKSARAHLLGTYCLGRFYDEKKTQARREAYTKELDLHLAKYPYDATVNEAYFLKAQLEEQRLQATQALPLYLQVDVQHTRALEAMLGAARCYETILRRMIEQHRPAEAFEREGIDQMSRFLSLSANALDKWTVAQADIALHLASFLLMSSHESAKTSVADSGEPSSKTERHDIKRSARPELARHWLDQVTKFTEQPGHDKQFIEALQRLLQRAKSLNVIALAGTGKRAEAQRTLSELNATPRELLNLVDQLVPFISAAQGDARIQLAALQIQAAERVQSQREQLSPAETALLDRCRMKASLFAGQTSRAVELGEQLTDRFPSDVGLQQELATLFGESSDSVGGELAKKCWRRMESLSKPGSIEWLTARLGQIQSCARLQQLDEARKLLQVTKVLHPELGSPTIKSQFDSIEQALKTGTRSKP